jgi:hypothetical protein
MHHLIGTLLEVVVILYPNFEIPCLRSEVTRDEVQAQETTLIRHHPVKGF